MTIFRNLIAVVFALHFVGTAQAESGRETVFQLTPYVWATGVGGDIRPSGNTPTVTVSQSFSALLRDLDAAFFLSAFARHGNLVFLGDFSTSNSSRAGTIMPGTNPASAKLRQMSVTALAGYRVMPTPDASVDLLAGARHWRIRGTVDLPAVPGVFPGATVSRTVSFTDPLIAARTNIRLRPGWSALLYADVGGFGAGSRFTAQLLGAVNYQIRDNTFVSVGYRHLQVDYRSGGTRFDMRMGGPILGASFRF